MTVMAALSVMVTLSLARGLRAERGERVSGEPAGEAVAEGA